MCDNDQKLVQTLLTKLDDQRILLSQRNNVVSVLQHNFGILKTMCETQAGENLQLKDQNARLSTDKKRLQDH
jgi:hypothetical protein